MDYIVLRDCFGFQNRYWEKGEKVSLAETEKPPRHFQPLSQVQVDESQIEQSTEAVTGALEVQNKEVLSIPVLPKRLRNHKGR
jgi:hypothetical protein